MTIKLRPYMAKKLPGEVALKAWSETGSLKKAALMLANDGYKNSLNQPVSAQFVWRTAIEYCLYNLDGRRYFGDVPDEEWELYLVKGAMNIYRPTPKKFAEWANAYPWVKNYEYLYSGRYTV